MDKLNPNDPEMMSTDIVSENLTQLKALFPEAFVEGKVDFDVLKQLLGGAVDEREEKYGLNWHGKRLARQFALTPSFGTLRPCPEDSVDWETTQNLMIEGDNLEVLKLLQKSYAGKVKLIYIDPPYNTGKDFVYPDHFKESIDNYMAVTGQAEGGENFSTNVESSGRFHTTWLNMLYPRLKVARFLLREEGAIFVSIDEGECFHLRAMMDELFGKSNFIATFVWRRSGAGGLRGDFVIDNHEYIVAYAKNLEASERWYAPYSESSDEAFNESDEKGPYKTQALYLTSLKQTPNQAYGIELPDGTMAYPPKGVGSWRFIQFTFAEWLERGDVVFKETSQSPLRLADGSKSRYNIYTKQYRDARGTNPSTWLTEELAGQTRSAKALLQNIFGGISPFDYAKPLKLLELIVKMVATGSDDVVMDFFAGSGTTGHAVLASNASDGKGRRYILVQLPEPLSLKESSQKAAAECCDTLGVRRTIAELTKERLRRAGKRISEQNAMLDGDFGFRVFKLDSSNIQPWEPLCEDLPQTLENSIERLRTDRAEIDILFEVLLKLGLDLCVPIETRSVAGKELHSIGGGVLIACLAESIAASDIEPLAQGIITWHEELEPAATTTCVFRDGAFADDVAKTNLSAILQQHKLTNVKSL